jgi:hypothetical protein
MVLYIHFWSEKERLRKEKGGMWMLHRFDEPAYFLLPRLSLTRRIKVFVIYGQQNEELWNSTPRDRMFPSGTFSC